MNNSFIIKILFDATILAEGLHKTSNRSGIYWASLGIFNQLSKRRDVELGIYAAPSFVNAVNEFLAQNFPGKGYSALNRSCSTFWGDLWERLVIAKPSRLVRFAKLVVKVSRILQDKYVGSKQTVLLADKFDAFFSPVYLAPWAIRKYSRVLRFTVLHDTIPMLFPQFSPFTLLGFSWNFDLIKGLEKDDYTFANSECTKKDFLRFSKKMSEDRASVIHLAADEKFFRVSDKKELLRVRRKYGIPDSKRYVLSLCTIEPRKNLGMALKAFGRFLEKSGSEDVVFVLAGGKWARFEKKWTAILEKLSKYRDLIIHVGYVDDEDLAAIYSGAEMFVYPSLYEGFGLPPLEAMKCGTPVITSNVSSLPEVVGDAAITVDPRSIDSLTDAMLCLDSDVNKRHECIERGLARAKEFTWERACDIIIDKIKEASK